jgi:hypothetical protein
MPKHDLIGAEEAGLLYEVSRKWYKHTNFTHTLLRTLVFGRCVHTQTENSLQFDVLTMPNASEADVDDYVALLECRQKCEGMSQKQKSLAFSRFMQERRQRRQQFTVASSGETSLS